MKILIVGLGSMGKKRLRIIRKNFSEFPIYAVESREDRRNDVSKEYNIEVFASLDEAFDKQQFSVVFVCSSPLSHKDIVLNSLKNGCHTFSEINLVSDGYDEITEYASNNKLIAFLSSTLLYRKEIEWIIEETKKKIDEKITYRYHVGQYLPDWHPSENYTDYFVGDKRTNGCREIFAIEFPWIIKAFGEITNFHVIKNKITDLKINYPDNYHLIIEHVNGIIGNFSVNLVARNGVRNLEIISQNSHITWDAISNNLAQYSIEEKKMNTINPYKSIKKDANYSSNVIEDAYCQEIKDFFNIVKAEKGKTDYSYIKDLNILEIIDRIEDNI